MWTWGLTEVKEAEEEKHSDEAEGTALTLINHHQGQFGLKTAISIFKKCKGEVCIAGFRGIVRSLNSRTILN